MSSDDAPTAVTEVAAYGSAVEVVALEDGAGAALGSDVELGTPRAGSTGPPTQPLA